MCYRFNDFIMLYQYLLNYIIDVYLIFVFNNNTPNCTHLDLKRNRLLRQNKFRLPTIYMLMKNLNIQ